MKQPIIEDYRDAKITEYRDSISEMRHDFLEAKARVQDLEFEKEDMILKLKGILLDIKKFELANSRQGEPVGCLGRIREKIHSEFEDDLSEGSV